MNPQSHSAALRGPRPQFAFGDGGGANRLARTLLALGLAALLCLPACSFTPDEAESASSRNTPAAEATSHLTFRTDEKLQQHFEKHGWETGCATTEEYLAAANAVIADPASLHKLQAEDGDDLYFLERTGEFVVVSPAGYIRTYYLTDRDYFDRQ
ncbi:hypothetical protein VJ923_03465 [Adlercreutzia sp. R25]|uniref:Lipoprotein n=1 Tax=Adlercreutzia shanghongiae TaxID=3111773 RepID=A0ABU6IW76_9ACTN|nr:MULTISPECIES: hypothetical protein [unclassified Adlercreutzia]MEC4272217.1 hypothetical protein [Adlercreutzia sp. R25]MEC4293945.1 hypothetical protein [Adlercreutzia sp. R22]